MPRKKTRGRGAAPLRSLAAIARQIGEKAEARKREERRKIIERYARKKPDGSPMLCKPSKQEKAEGSTHSELKIIYDTETDARKAARELRKLGARPMAPYPCPRSRHGHLHLRTIKRGK